jgi:glycosyltransferase involved in cell wall biosynthesis
MRIALLAPFGMQPKGTTSARIMPLAHALARRGHQVRVVIPPWDDPTARPGTQYLANNGIQIEVVTLPLPKRAPKSIALTYGLVSHALRPFPHNSALRTPHSTLDMVHVFKPIGYSGMAALILQAMRVPWVLDVDDWEGPGGWVDNNPYSPAQKLAITVMESLLPRLARAVTAASRTLEARAWDFGLPRKRVFYMPNGVSREKYGSWSAPDTVGALREAPVSDAPTILLYTRFAEFPFWWPLDVLKRVLEDHPNARLLVVGSGFFGEEQKLRAEADRMGLGDHVTITGWVPEEDLPAQLRLGDVAIYPMADNLINRAKSPAKLLELMVMGLPVVAHRVGETSEFLGDAGVLVEEGNLQGMGDAVSALLSDPTRSRLLGEKARERVWSRFNWDRLCQAAEQAYAMATK